MTLSDFVAALSKKLGTDIETEGDSCATLSLDPDTGRVRLQRFDSFEALEEAGPDKAFVAFADVAAAWAELIRARFRNLSDSTSQPTAMKPRKLVDNPAGLRAINPSG